MYYYKTNIILYLIYIKALLIVLNILIKENCNIKNIKLNISDSFKHISFERTHIIIKGI